MDAGNELKSDGDPGRAWWLTGLLVLLLAYGGMLFYRGLLDPDEGRYAEIPREMAASGNWREMRLQGYRYYEKPPLAYWMVAPAISLCGARDWAVRIPLLVNICFLAALFSILIRPHWNKVAGRTALWVLLSMAGFFVGFCLVLTDGFLVFWFSATCASLFRAFQREAPPARRLIFLGLAAVSAGLGFLTKGAVAVVLPALILVAWLAWERRLRALLTADWLPAGLVFFALLVPCLGWIERHNPGFLRAFIFDEHLARFTGSRLSQLHAEPWWFYLALLPLLAMPWTFFGVRAIRNVIVRRRLADDSLARFFVVWIAVVLIFFSLSAGKLLSYILPALPPLGLLLGRWGLAEPPDGSALDRRLWNLGMVGPWLAVGVTLVILAASVGNLAPRLMPPASGGLALVFLLLTLLALSVIGLRAARRLPGALLLAAGLLGSIALLLSPLAGKEFNALCQVNSSRVYQALAAGMQPEDQLVVFCKYRPSVPFYLEKLPYLCYGMNELKAGILMERERPNYLWTRDHIRRLVDSCPGRVYAIMSTKDYRKRFRSLGLDFVPVDFDADPETTIVQLMPGEPAGSRSSSAADP